MLIFLNDYVCKRKNKNLLICVRYQSDIIKVKVI